MLWVWCVVLCVVGVECCGCTLQSQKCPAPQSCCYGIGAETDHHQEQCSPVDTGAYYVNTYVVLKYVRIHVRGLRRWRTNVWKRYIHRTPEACAEFNFLPSDFRTSTFEATQCLSMGPMQQ